MNIISMIESGEFELSVTACNKTTNWQTVNVMDADKAIFRLAKQGQKLEQLYKELGKLKWAIGADNGWEQAILAVRNEIETMLQEVNP